MMGADEKPDVSYADIGGSDIQKQEIREAVELPLTVGALSPAHFFVSCVGNVCERHMVKSWAPSVHFV
jgi:hypothetical protein